MRLIGDGSNREVIDLTADSDSESMGAASSVDYGMLPFIGFDNIHLPRSLRLDNYEPSEPSSPVHASNSSSPDPPVFHSESDTYWLDDDVTSMRIYGKTSLTSRTRVECVEKVNGLPTVWPVPRIKTAYLLDLTDDEDAKKFAAAFTIDNIIKDNVSKLLFSAMGYLTTF